MMQNCLFGYFVRKNLASNATDMSLQVSFSRSDRKPVTKADDDHTKARLARSHDATLLLLVGGNTGRWKIERVHSVVGEGLGGAACLDINEGHLGALPAGASWLLRGVVSHARYTNRDEQERLVAIQPVLGRKEATCAALIPIAKSAAWWTLTQDERREILEAPRTSRPECVLCPPSPASWPRPGRTVRFPDMV